MIKQSSKNLQQATGAGRYVKCSGNAGDKQEIFNDPQFAFRNGGNLMGFTTDIQLMK